ncbi:MAG: STAS-like domain-containing protein [Terriglobia bacterium]
MTGLRKRGEKIRQAILAEVESHPRDIALHTASTFNITRQAASRHVKALVDQGALVAFGHTRSRTYKLRPLAKWTHNYRISDGLEEDVIWRNDIRPHLGEIPDNVRRIWQYGFTEMFNNAIDHSSGKTILVELSMTALNTVLAVYDDGEGIFRKICRELSLNDERHAVLELSKGKLTTDPDQHSGEGIFFTSRMFDRFAISSGDVFFSHTHGDRKDWILEEPSPQRSTIVFMKLKNNTARTVKQVYEEFSEDDGFGFTKTVVPVRLARYGDERLVSRSQAKRLLAGLEKFKVVLLDFEDVDTIGKPFADEVFRVFAERHPGVRVAHVEANKEILAVVAGVSR